MNNNQTFLRQDNQNLDTVRSETIGLSEQQRPLTVNYLSNSLDALPLKVLVIAGQHGNEKYGRKAVKMLIDSLHFDTDFPHIELAVLPNANPDGSFQKTRRNAIGIDLNRDHQRLDSKELRAVHSFIRAWKPHVVVDVHNIRSKRKDLLAKNLILYHDVFIDVPTNPAVNQPLDHDKINDFLKTVQSDLKSLGFNCDRYAMLKRSGRVRHSTLDLNEALNSLSLRYGIFTILLEGRTPIREDGKTDKEHVILAQYHAVCAILRWVQAHMNHLIQNGKNVKPAKGDIIALRCKYKPNADPVQMIFKNSTTKLMNVVALPNYTSNLKITKYVQLPAAYAVPLDKTKLIENLSRHGLMYQFSNSSKDEYVECYNIVPKAEQSIRYKSSPRIWVMGKIEQRRLENYAIFPVNQEGGNSLAMFLEPKSMYGLQRYADLGLSTLPGSQYPILRVL